MKFDNGHWVLLPGTTAIYPVSIVDVRVEKDALEILGFDRPVSKRSDFLDGAAIVARFTSPMPDVIRVRITHFKGRRPRLPVFDLDYERTNPSASAGRDEQHAWLKVGRLSVETPVQGEWRFEFRRDGRLMTSSENRAVGLFAKNGETFMREQLSLSPGETVYGLGERFGPFVKNGQSVDIWNEDGGTDSEIAYKNVPFYVTSAGYGVLVNHPGLVSFEVASHNVNRVQFSARDHGLDYYVFGGPTPREALEQYTALSGRPPRLPEWSFGLWLTTSFLTNYDEPTVLANIKRMADEGVPVKVFHFDCHWMKELTWCSFLWDDRHFPDPQGMLHRIKQTGVKICVWINPYIAEAAPMFEEGARLGYLLTTPQGDVYQVDKWQPGMALVDFTNPAACAWFSSKLRNLIDMGVDCFKTDFGERIPVDVRYHDGSDPERMHNYYTYLYNKTVFDLLRTEKGEGEAVLFARSATCGNQQFPVHWGGDNHSTYTSMAETLRGGLSFGMCGFGYWSHDMSGFGGTATPDLYKRWVAFGMLSSHSRLHGYDTARMPWLFGEESVNVLRFFMRLKHHLMPYLMDAAQEATDHGWPMMRAMVLEFPGDVDCRYLDQQYMMGPALLVAPVFNEEGEVSFYLPEGEWRNLLTGETARGPVRRKETHGYFSLPLWVHVERGARWKCLEKFSAD